MKFKAIDNNGWIYVVNIKSGYIAEEGFETLEEAKKTAKWMNENN